ncbi:MAG: HEAT repeat domain-containing protein [Gemmataceae bacterium]
MLRSITGLFVLVLVVGGSIQAREDEPTFLDKKLSYWVDQLETGKETKARRRSILALEQIGFAGSRQVVTALAKSVREDRDPVVRAAAARALGRTVARAMEQARAEKKDELPRLDFARDALGSALRTEKTDTVREAAALALGDLGPDARGAVGTLSQALKDKHLGTVRAAAQTLRRMGRDAREAQLELQGLLADRKGDTEARVDAALCLGQIRPDLTQALPVLREAIADEKNDPQVRRAVVESLGKLGKEAADATPSLAALLAGKDTSPELRLAAVTAIDQFGPDGKQAIPALIRATADPELIKSMGEQARFIRCLAMQSLGRMGKDLDRERKEAVTALLRAMEDPSVEVSVSAIESVGSLASEGLAGEADEVVKKLDTLLLREGRKSLREAAQAARDRIRPKK